MSTYAGGTERGAATSSSRTHSKANAVDERGFERLVAATHELDEYEALQSRFILFAAGRFGLRAGELCHFKADWVDLRRRMIAIPAFEPCRKGRDGGICGYCRQHARQMADHNPDVSLEAATASRWEPKTDAAAREIPLEAHTRGAMVVEEFCDRFGDFPDSRTTINRRVNRLCELADELPDDATNPHGLRATAASYYASRGLDVIAMQSLFGWADLQTAHCYVRRSGERTAQALRDIQR